MMSSALAIASVTTVLKNLLDNGLILQSATTGMGDISVTALPPDRIPAGAEERAQLNLYLYRVTPNSAWRRTNKFAGPEGRSDIAPLALDLHYLLTAYGERDFQAEILLGHAIQCLHEKPILTREIIRSAQAAILASANGAIGTALSTSTLVDQVEEIKISLEFLSMDEMSKLWSGLQTRSRLSVTYLVSTIIMTDQRVHSPSDV